MRITRDKALAMTAYCRRMKLTYASEGQYPHGVAAQKRAGTAAPNGVRIHIPKTIKMYNPRRFEPAIMESRRAYIMWYGEPIPAIEEACAFICMTTRDMEIYVIRCSEASIAATIIEQQEAVTQLCDDKL